MTIGPQEPKEHPSTYIVQDRSNEEELTRLQIQDQLVTMDMGGVLSEQPDLDTFKRVLDVGCGTGGWLIQVAKTIPTAKMLIGVDISRRMVEFAREQAREQGVADRVEFHTMDALRMLEFPQGYFDLVNQRFGVSYLRTWDWPNLLQEYQRVSKRNGVIRITEGDILVGNAPAFNELYSLFQNVMANAGHLFFPANDGLTRALESTMHQAGISNLQTRNHLLEYHAGTREGRFFSEGVKLVFRTTLPFLRKWTRLPDNYESLYQQALAEMQQPDFVATWRLLTVWGTTPST